MRLLERRTRELERHLPGAAEGKDRSVHQARVASRRLREAVPVLAGQSKRSRKAERKIRRVTRALGTVREMDVALKILDDLARRPAIPRSSLEDLRGHVLAERERRREVMLARMRKVNTPKLKRRLAQVSDCLASSADGAWRGTLAARLDARAKRLVTAVQAAGQMYEPERLHRVRIAAKKLRYALELAADAGLPAASPLVASLKRTQDTLGRLNDLHVIQKHLAMVQANPPDRQGATDGGLDVIARTLEEECRHLHARYIKQVPGLLELGGTCRTTVLASLRPGARSTVKMKSARETGHPEARRA